METSPSSRVVIVSGGSKGLGAGIVEAFLRQGDRVATFSRRPTPQVEQWRQTYGDRFFYTPLDMTDRDGCKAFVRRVHKELGPIQVLVNNAGLARSSVLGLAREDDIDQVIDLNLRATVVFTKLVTRKLMLSPWGRIINISSIVGLSGYRGLSVYSATKAALDGFTRSLARELGTYQITVNSVAPGYVRTDMSDELSEGQMTQITRRTPLGRLGTAEDIADAVAFLAAERTSFITGQVLVVDGGITC